MASGTFYDSWGPTNTSTNSSNRYHQNHLKVTWSSDSTKVTYTINAYARSGNGSGYYYMSQYGVTVTLYYKLNGGNWISLGSASGTLNYNDNVANITKTVTINRTHSSQTIKFAADSTGNSLYSISHQTGNDTIGALASYAVSYNANGGTGAPANQTKWHGETLTLTSSTPSRASSTQNGYMVTFNSNGGGYANTSVTAKNTITYGLKTGTNRWNTNSAGTGTGYASGGSYTSNAALTLYAQWTQTSSPGSVNIPNEMKKRDGYTFQGWGTTTAETSIVATAGATTYQPNGNVTLYAIWKQNYIPVALTNIKAIRVATPGSTTTADTGPVGYITANWTKGNLNGTEYNASKIIYSYSTTGEEPHTDEITFTASESATTTSFWIDNLSIDNSWSISVTTIDSHDNSQSSKVTLLSPAFFTMDFLKGGKGIAFGKPATITSVFDVGFNTQINNSITSTPVLTVSAVTIDNITPTAVSITGTTKISGATTINGATTITGSTTINGIYFGLDNSGKPIDAFINANSQAAFQKALYGVADTSWAYLVGNSSSTNFCRWRCKSGWVQIEIYYGSGASLTAKTAKSIGTIPADYRPNKEINSAAYLGASVSGQSDIWVDSGGHVYIVSTVASSTFYGSLNYPLNV